MDSLGGYNKYPIIVSNQYEYEVGKIRWVVENTNIDEFVLLQDSCVVKDAGIFDLCFDKNGTVTFDPKFRSYMGKWLRHTLKKTGIPLAKNKHDAVILEEDWAHRIYLANETVKSSLFDTFSLSNAYEDRHGRKNMVLENRYIKKWKGTWHRNQLRK